MNRPFSAVATLLVALLAPATALANPSPREKAAAEALFQQGAALMAQENFAEACVKFEGSQELDPALGTMLRLADCYDRVGRTASAWALFQEAVAKAGASNQSEREQIATQRAKDLEARLTRVTLNVPSAARVPGLQLRLNGAVIPEASWNAPLPVDPGLQKVEASAPNHQTWSSNIEAPVGPNERAVEVPVLEALREEPRSEVAPAAPVAAALPIAPPQSGSALRTVGYVTAGVGLAGLAVGGILGYRAYDLNDQSLSQCRASDPNACTPRGKSLRDDARSFATTSTIVAAAGGVLLAAGVTLVIAAPSSERPVANRELRLRTTALAQGGRVTLEGSF